MNAIPADACGGVDAVPLVRSDADSSALLSLQALQFERLMQPPQIGPGSDPADDDSES